MKPTAKPQGTPYGVFAALGGYLFTNALTSVLGAVWAIVALYALAWEHDWDKASTFFLAAILMRLYVK